MHTNSIARIAGFLLTPFIVCACGGGSSGGSGLASSLATSTSTTIINSSSSRTNSAPEFTVLFPHRDGEINAKTAIVRGTARDDIGVKAVLVNGTAVSLTPVVMQPSASSNTLLNIFPNVEWEAEIQLPVGETKVRIEVIDSDGIKVDNTDQELTLRHREIPVYWLNDVTNNRWIGSNGKHASGIIAIDKTTREVKELPAQADIYTSSELSGDGEYLYTNEIVASEVDNTATLSIYSTNLQTGYESRIAKIDLEDVSPRHYWEAIEQSAFDPARNHYYLVVNAWAPSSSLPFESKIVRVDVSDGTHTVISNASKSGLPSLYIHHILFAKNTLFVMTPPAVYTVDTTTGKVDQIAAMPATRGSFGLAMDEKNDHLYIPDLTDIARLDLKDGSVELISDDFAHSPLNFNQVYNVHFDNGQLLVNDMTAAITVNPLTGFREHYLHFGIGDGVKMIGALDLVVNTEKTIAYVLDRGWHTPPRLIEVNLVTGNRTTLFQGPARQSVGSLILDEADNRLFFTIDALVISYDLATKEVKQLYETRYEWSPDFYIGDLVLDKLNNRLLFNDQSGFLSAIDLATNAIAPAFNTKEGTGPTILSSTEMVMIPKRKQVIIKPYTDDRLIALDLVSGARALVQHDCSAHGISIAKNEYLKLRYDEDLDNVFIVDDSAITTINLETMKCSQTRTGNFLTDAWPLTDEFMLTVNNDRLGVLDKKTKQNLIISR